MLTFVSGDISLHNCDALLFTCIEDFPNRFHDKFDRVLEYRRKLEKSEKWKPGCVVAQVPEPGSGKKIVVHADLGDDPDTVRNLVDVINGLKPLAKRVQDRFVQEYMDAQVKGSHIEQRRFRSIALPRIGVHLGYSWATVRDILKLVHSEPNPPYDKIDQAFHAEVYDSDIPGQRPQR